MPLPLVFCLVLGVLLSAAAQVVLKLAMMKPQVQASIAALPSTGVRALAWRMAQVPELYGGLALYMLSMLVWLYVLSRVDVSLAYPFVGLGIVVTTLAGALLLGEPVGAMRLAGCVLVAAGIALVAKS